MVWRWGFLSSMCRQHGSFIATQSDPRRCVANRRFPKTQQLLRRQNLSLCNPVSPARPSPLLPKVRNMPLLPGFVQLKFDGIRRPTPVAVCAEGTLWIAVTSPRHARNAEGNDTLHSDLRRDRDPLRRPHGVPCSLAAEYRPKECGSESRGTQMASRSPIGGVKPTPLCCDARPTQV